MAILAGLAALGFPAVAQQAAPTMGSVATHDALVTGGLEVRGEKANLVSNASITAYDRTAPVTLQRGGEILVCSTSQFHLLHSGAGDSLLFGLDRGSIEIHSPSQPQDVILTPDLRFTLASQGKLDLRIRVTSNGDTCVDNAGSEAPALQITDVFSSESYRLTAGQHVLFEHGSLHEVVDRESSSCGCPEAMPVVQEAASGASGGSTPAAVAAQNPFPTAVSQGLAPPPAPANSAPIGVEHVQVTDSLAYNPGQPDPSAAPAPPPVKAVPVSTQPPPSPPGAGEIFHAVGRFFHKLFHPNS
jgi:hypothetical protein